MKRPPFRAYIGLSLFLCTSITYMYRTCFTLVLRDMVESSATNTSTDSPKIIHDIEVTRYNWSADQQIYLISAYFIGYIITNLFGGVLAERFGATKTISVILAVTAISFASIPKIVSFGYVPLFALRVFQGCIEGPIYPAIHHIIAYWAPPTEKGRFVSIFAGSSFGGMIGHGIVGGVSVHHWGWSSSFYCTAVIGGLVWFYWVCIVADRPDLQRHTTDKEKVYIESAIGSLVNRDSKRIPHWTILKSGPVWALILLNFGASFTNNFQLNSLPTYYNEVLGFLVPEIATIFAISSLIRFGTGLSFSYLGDVLIKRDCMGLTTQRKFFCVFSHIIPGVILICMCFLTKHPLYSAALDVLNTAIMGAINLTVNQNSHDLSPNFSSSIYGIVNFTGSIGGFVTLYILALFFNIEESAASAWIDMFILSAVLLFVSTAAFLVWGTGKTQLWNEPAMVTDSETTRGPEGSGMQRKQKMANTDSS